jgi:hypothetical protein
MIDALFLRPSLHLIWYKEEKICTQRIPEQGAEEDIWNEYRGSNRWLRNE